MIKCFRLSEFFFSTENSELYLGAIGVCFDFYLFPPKICIIRDLILILSHDLNLKRCFVVVVVAVVGVATTQIKVAPPVLDEIVAHSLIVETRGMTAEVP